MLREGENEFFIYSETEHHMIEINWPVRNAPAQQVPIRIIVIPEIVEHERVLNPVHRHHRLQ